MIDPWAANALADDLAASNPWAVQQALSEAPPPKMFAGGTSDLPPFTASGLEPEMLLLMPYQCRHAMAAEPNRAAVLAAFEADSTNAYASYPAEGLTAAEARIRTYAAGRDWDPLQALRDQQDQQDAAAAQQKAVNEAFTRGGKSASDALIAQYRAAAAAQQTEADRNYAQAMDAMGWNQAAGMIVPKR